MTLEKALKRYKVRWQRAWRNRPHPYWFCRVYPDGAAALHVGPVEVFRRAIPPGSEADRG